MKIEILNDGGLTCFKGVSTLVEEKELETFDNYIHEIAEEYCKMTFKEKDQILTQRLIKKQEEEIERLKNGYCELKVKCNNGECDCTNEEYDGMVESNMKLSLEVERLNNIIKEAINYIDDNTYYKDHKGHINIDDVYIILQGSDKE